MKDVEAEAYRLTRSVAMEEMFHAYQAANLLIAAGGTPLFTGANCPVYPTFIPYGNPDATPYIGLRKATTEVYRDVFMKIETPAPYEAPAETGNVTTIGQFYKAIEEGFERVNENYPGELFVDTPGYTQMTDYYLGKSGGFLVQVTDMASARLAIHQIVEQGEGGVEPGKTLVPQDMWGAYNHYGTRVDGNFGPITGGVSQELSHYFKFKQVADGVAPIPDTWPVIADVKSASYGKNAQGLSDLFNGVYSLFLEVMERSFTSQARDNGLYFKTALPIMHNCLPGLALTMMQTCVWDEGDASVGPNAMPTWRFTETRLSDLKAQAGQAEKNLEDRLDAAVTLAETTTLQSLLGRVQSVRSQLADMEALNQTHGWNL